MKVFSFSKREQVILYIFAAVLAVYGVYEFVYAPFQRKAIQIDSQVEAMERKLQKAYEMIRAGEGLDERIRGQFDDMVLTKTPEEEMSSLLAEIEGLASEAKIQIADMKPQPVSAQDRIFLFSVKLALNYDLKTTMNFIRILQDAPHSLTVDEFSFERASPDKGNLRCILFVSRLRLRPI